MALVVASLCVRAQAAGGAATDTYDDVAERSPLDAHALLDVYALHNFAAPASRENQLREWDSRADRPALGLLRATVASRPTPIGYRLDVGVGDTVDAFYRADPAAADHPTMSRWLSRIEQGIVTVAVPAYGGISVDVGKFGTPVGLEDNESPGNWSYSRSLLYSFAESTLHAGVRATHRPSRAFAWSVFWVNGWNANVADGNGLRTLAAAMSWTPTDTVALALVYMGGPERALTHLADATLSMRHVVDVIFRYTPSDRVSLAATADYGADRAEGGVRWWGAAGYARVRWLAWMASAIRGEYFADPYGFTTGTRQGVVEATLTHDFLTTLERARIALRLELRHDHSSALAFEGAEGTRRRTQDTLTLAVTAAY